MATITIKVRREKVGVIRRLLFHITGLITGKKQDPADNLTKAIIARFVHIFWTRIHAAFLDKSDGGTDEFGDQWKPLSPATIAQRALTPSQAKKLGKAGLGGSGRGLLTPPQNKLWKAIFWKNFSVLALQIGEKAAKVQAAKMAWGFIKKRGGKTKLEVLGNRKVPILVVSHKLEKSLRPGRVSGTTYTPPTNQIFQSASGSLTIGSEVPYASRQHRTRAFWPTGTKLSPFIAEAFSQATQEASVAQL